MLDLEKEDADGAQKIPEYSLLIVDNEFDEPQWALEKERWRSLESSRKNSVTFLILHTLETSQEIIVVYFLSKSIVRLYREKFREKGDFKG